MYIYIYICQAPGAGASCPGSNPTCAGQDLSEETHFRNWYFPGCVWVFDVCLSVWCVFDAWVFDVCVWVFDVCLMYFGCVWCVWCVWMCLIRLGFGYLWDILGTWAIFEMSLVQCDMCWALVYIKDVFDMWAICITQMMNYFMDFELYVWHVC